MTDPDPILVDNVTQSLEHVRFWLRRPGMRLTEIQREILYDIVSIALADEPDVAIVPTDWPIVDQIVEIANALQSATHATEESMNLLARVRMQLHAYDEGSRSQGLMWQMAATVKTFSTLQTKAMKGG